MEKIHENTYTKHARFHVFLHLVLSFTPHYIITDKGLLRNVTLVPAPAPCRQRHFASG